MFQNGDDAPTMESASELPKDIPDNEDGERPQKRLKMAEEDEDPAEFLLSNTKYHDCHLTVGDPETDDVEKIGVSSTHLIAHSSVFRQMLAESELADPAGAKTHIKDVSPATFKLMLRHVYGGELPQIPPEEAVDLALCADKYNIQRLMGKAANILKPTSAEDVFIALMVVTYINCPDLELRVTKIIQQETKKLFQNPLFLEIDESHILFIVQQSMLNISELELWNNLVLWAENQVKTNQKKTLRGCLGKVLPYVRLLTLTDEEITKHVLPAKVLTPDEYVDLSLAVTKKQPIQSPGLCSFQEKRVIYGRDIKEKNFSDNVFDFNKEYVFTPEKQDPWYTVEEIDQKEHSTLTIEPTKHIKIDSLVFECFDVRRSNEDYLMSTDITCNIQIYTFIKGLQERLDSVTLKGRGATSQTVSFPVIKDNGQPLILEAGKMHTLRVSVTPALPTHKLFGGGFDCTSCKHEEHGMIVKFEDPFHIRQIAYSVQE